MKTLLVVAHPRQSSLTFAVAQAFADQIRKGGHSVEWADLVRERFDPVLMTPDEPDWNDPNKVYSAPVRAEMQRIARNEWNHGWACGGKSYPHRRVWLIGVAGVGAESYANRHYDAAMRTQLEVGLLEFCGIERRRVELLYGATEGEPHPSAALARAHAFGAMF